MENKTDEAMKKIQYDVNVAKSRLIEVVDKLEEDGAIRKASSLRTIIGKLENWQHTK